VDQSKPAVSSGARTSNRTQFELIRMKKKQKQQQQPPLVSTSYSSPALIIKSEIDFKVGHGTTDAIVADDLSCITDLGGGGGGNSRCGTAESLSSKSTLNLTRYFGVGARNEFGHRIKWLSNQRQLLFHQSDELLEKTRFESSYTIPSSVHGGGDEGSESFSHHLPDQDPDDDLTLDNGGMSSRICPSHRHHDDEGGGCDDANSSHDSFDIHTIHDDLHDGTITSPRTKYITACLKQNLNPRMSFILRKRISSDLNLQHQGMGDTLGILFADSLRELPYVHSINLNDNNLTDLSIGPIIRSILTMTHVTSLNLSNNLLNSNSTTALADYLSSPSCTIKRLILQDADLDDHECHMFVQALTSKTSARSLIELDLSKNKIGQAEILNTVQPDYITGGEALADMLASNVCQLQVLNLSWNLIRLDGGIALAGCVATNQYVTSLDLSYNALGKDGGEVLGSALLKNTVLHTLQLANNNINFSACFAICVALEENFSLRKLSLDGNPIGEGGGRALMQVPFTAGTPPSSSFAF
jgi:Ran GTPase-activating protein (RanGAP) involved in mRNA processing and transport